MKTKLQKKLHKSLKALNKRLKSISKMFKGFDIINLNDLENTGNIESDEETVNNKSDNNPTLDSQFDKIIKRVESDICEHCKCPRNNSLFCNCSCHKDKCTHKPPLDYPKTTKKFKSD